MAATRNPELAAYFRRLAARASALVFAHPYLLPLLQLTGRTRPVLLDLHNVEAVLKAGLLERHPDADLLVPFVEALEAFGCAMADRIVTVSAEDAAEIARRHGPGSVTIIPNGADLCPAPLVEAARAARRRRDWSQGFAAVFVGSGHAPNITAARLLVERVLPALPAMRLGIIGGVADALGDHAGHPGSTCSARSTRRASGHCCWPPTWR